MRSCSHRPQRRKRHARALQRRRQRRASEWFAGNAFSREAGVDGRDPNATLPLAATPLASSACRVCGTVRGDCALAPLTVCAIEEEAKGVDGAKVAHRREPAAFGEALQGLLVGAGTLALWLILAALCLMRLSLEHLAEWTAAAVATVGALGRCTAGVARGTIAAHRGSTLRIQLASLVGMVLCRRGGEWARRSRRPGWRRRMRLAEVARLAFARATVRGALAPVFAQARIGAVLVAYELGRARLAEACPGDAEAEAEATGATRTESAVRAGEVRVTEGCA